MSTTFIHSETREVEPTVRALFTSKENSAAYVGEDYWTITLNTGDGEVIWFLTPDQYESVVSQVKNL